MKIPSQVAYETGIAEFGIGEAIAYNPDTEVVTVVDEEDGSTWSGPVDLITPIDKA